MKKIIIITILAALMTSANAAQFFFEADDYGTVISTEEQQITKAQFKQIVKYGCRIDDETYYVECVENGNEYRYIVVLNKQEIKKLKKWK